MRIRKPLVALACLAAAAVATGVALGATHRAAVTPIVVTTPSPTDPTGIRLHGVVGPGFTISLGFGDFNNAPVTNLSPGTYTFTIDDLAAIHDFHLTGPGVNMTTTVPEANTVTTWTLALAPGTYKFVCDPHSSTMVGTFTVLPQGTVTSFPAPKVAKKKK